MNNKILSGLLILGISATGFAAFSNANEEGSILNGANEVFNNMEFKGEGNFKKGAKLNGNNRGELRLMDKLTTEEKTSLENMSDEEKKDFFESKREEFREKKEARETVIDALLAGETLTEEQEVIRAEIIKLRAERKIQMEENRVKKEEIREIMEKKKNGEELSEEETAKLEELKSNKGHGKMGKKGGFNSRGRNR